LISPMQFAEVDVTEGWRAPSLLVAKVPGGLCLLLETVGKVAPIEGGGATEDAKQKRYNLPSGRRRTGMRVSVGDAE
jgi:hypothetical protein